jgi:hypothetical protein
MSKLSRSTLRFKRDADFSQSNRLGRTPLAGLDSPSEFYQFNTAVDSDSIHASASQTLFHCFSRGLFPFNVFPATESHLAPTIPKSSVKLRPRAFATPRRFAPPIACRAYFIPVPSLGLSLRGFTPPLMLYFLSEASALMSFRRLQGIHTKGIPPEDPGLTEWPSADTSLGFLPARSPPAALETARRQLESPHVLF